MKVLIDNVTNDKVFTWIRVPRREWNNAFSPAPGWKLSNGITLEDKG